MTKQRPNVYQRLAELENAAKRHQAEREALSRTAASHVKELTDLGIRVSQLSEQLSKQPDAKPADKPKKKETLVDRVTWRIIAAIAVISFVCFGYNQMREALDMRKVVVIETGAVGFTINK